MVKHNNLKEQPIIVPADRLSTEALSGLIQEFVTRSGTDYGKRETSLEEKVSAIRKLLTNGRAKIIYAPSSQTFNIVLSKDIQPPGACRRQKGTP